MGSQESYWKKVCVQFGLPEDLIEEHIQRKRCCASPVALFLAARRQRLYISRSSGVFSRLERDGTIALQNVSHQRKAFQRQQRERVEGNTRLHV